MQNNTNYYYTSDIDIVYDPADGYYLYRSTLFNSMNKFLISVNEVVLGANLLVEQEKEIPSSNISYDRPTGNIAIKLQEIDYNKKFLVKTSMVDDLSQSPVIIYNTLSAKGKKLTKLTV